MIINSRLLKIAETIRRGDRVADIGTDHAYLPIYLIKKGISPKVFACDVADGPLQNAKVNIDKSSVDNIELRKGNGLNAVKPDEAETFVIAGMGGDLIIKILDASSFIKNATYEIILQPMTSVEDLRLYLCENGFFIKSESAVRSAGRIYTVIKAVYTGVKYPCEPLFYYIGALQAKTEHDIAYIKRKRRILTTLANDIKNIDSQQQKYLGLLDVIAELDRILKE